MLINNVGLYSVAQDYRLGHTVLAGSKNRLYCIYKREFFLTFAKQFKNFISLNPMFKDQEGESINLVALNNAIRSGCEFLVFIYPHKVYYAYTLMIKNFCEKNGLIRGQIRLNSFIKQDYTGKYIPESEVTYSFPKGLLNEVEDLGVFK